MSDTTAAIEAAAQALFEQNAAPDADYHAIARVAVQAALPHVLDLTGATVIHAHGGTRLMFVVKERLSMEAAHERLKRLSMFLPGVYLSLCDSTEQVIELDPVETWRPATEPGTSGAGLNPGETDPEDLQPIEAQAATS